MMMCFCKSVKVIAKTVTVSVSRTYSVQCYLIDEPITGGLVRAPVSGRDM